MERGWRAAPGASVITLMHRHDDAFSTDESLARDALSLFLYAFRVSPSLSFSLLLLGPGISSGNNLFFLGGAGLIRPKRRCPDYRYFVCTLRKSS